MRQSTVRVLEIGGQRFCKSVYPDSTTLLWTGWRPHAQKGPGIDDCTPGRFARAMRDLRAGRYDLVIVHPQQRSTLLPRYWIRSMAQSPATPYSAFMRVFGVSWLRTASIPVPLVAVDIDDHFGIGRHNFFLLDKADVFFKRELPVDRWQVLCGSRHPTLPTRRIRVNARWVQRLGKLRPIALPVRRIPTEQLWQGDFPEKNADIFYAGTVAVSSWVRRSGAAELDALAAHGVRIDMPSARMSPAEFHSRLSRAWLAWSPSGFGWECYRTSEAAQCLAVPLTNYPTIERYQPFRDGEHVVHYDVSPGGLTRAVMAALGDKDRLHRMAVAARQHALNHHLDQSIVDHVIEAGLSSRKR